MKTDLIDFAHFNENMEQILISNIMYDYSYFLLCIVSSKMCYKIDISRPSVLVIMFIYIIDKCAIAYHDINADFTLKKV